ncbi:MAG: filamentous hemagglutinin N-terminal domain-containing protein, partial [Gallionella sp.]
MRATISCKRTNFKFVSSFVAILIAFGMQSARANPVGASVVSGQANFTNVGNTLTVTNTPGTIINWQNFSIQQNEVTSFAQRSATSAVLNRVISNNPSSILGSLQSNGRVFLINPNGIVFGSGSTVDVAGMVASTLNLSNADFLSGQYNFTSVPSAGNVSNAGNINAQSGGQIYLIAPNVENTGVITAPNGEILLVAGHSVELVDTTNPNLRVNITAPAGNATNVGKLIASSGNLGLYGAMVRNSGTVSADSATMQGGKIVFKASVRSEISGSVSANGITGGAVEVLGNQVGVLDGATVSANGTQGGGTVLIGGDYQGKNANVQNAQVTYLAPIASISADATQNGNGGKLIVWSDDTTRVFGNISAKGGSTGGNGGFIETSGKHFLDVSNPADVAAAHGKGGTWLLDPFAITVVSTPTVGTLDTLNPNFLANAATSTVTNTVIQGALSLGTNVVLNTGAGICGTCNITVNAPILAQLPATGATLTMNAADSIFINQPITATAGALGLALNHGATGSATVANTLSLFGGSISVGNYGLTGVVTPGIGSIIFTGGSTALSGNLTSSSLSISGGTLNLNNTASNSFSTINVNSGYLSTLAPTTVGALNVAGGTLTGAGYTVTGATSLNGTLSLDGTTLNTQGTTTQTVNGSSANLYLLNSAKINNSGSWTGNNLNVYQGVGLPGSFNILGAGALNVAGNTYFSVPFNNNSTAANSVNITAGTLTLVSGGSSTGAFNVGLGAGLTLAGGTNTLSGAFNGSGTLAFSNGTNSIVAATGSTFAPSALSMSGGTNTVVMPAGAAWTPAT